MKKLIYAFALTATLLTAACNTVRGAGEDVESVADCADEVENNC